MSFKKDLKDFGKGVRNGVITLLAYATVLSCIENAGSWCSEELENKSSIERAVDEEKKALGIEKKDIGVIVNDTIYVRCAGKVGEGKYEIYLSEPETRDIIKHELYHIADGHCDEPYSITKYLFWYEPQAAIYSLTGLKL
jgi:hypothetical protein